MANIMEPTIVIKVQKHILISLLKFKAFIDFMHFIIVAQSPWYVYLKTYFREIKCLRYVKMTLPEMLIRIGCCVCREHL